MRLDDLSALYPHEPWSLSAALSRVHAIDLRRRRIERALWRRGATGRELLRSYVDVTASATRLWCLNAARDHLAARLAWPQRCANIAAMIGGDPPASEVRRHALTFLRLSIVTAWRTP